MSTTLDQPGAAPHNTKPLWVAVGLLGAVVIAMGGALLYMQGKNAATTAMPVAAITAPAPAALPPAATAKAPADDPAPNERPVATPAKPAPAAAKSAAKQVHRQVAQSAPVPVQAAPAGVPAPVVQPAPRMVCANCGTVESVTPIERSGHGSGLGAVGGGVVGALLGNQVGKGSGRTAATVLGAIGGGVAGNAIEKRVKKETVYQVGIRMEDGSYRTTEQGAPVAVGARVTVEGGSLRTSDGAVIPPVAAPKPVPQNSAADPNPIRN